MPKWLQLRSRLCPDCGEDGEWERGGGVGDEDRPAETGGQQASARPSRSRRSVRKPSVQTETKHIELMVVNDNDMVRSSTLAGVRWVSVVTGARLGEGRTAGRGLETLETFHGAFQLLVSPVSSSQVLRHSSSQAKNFAKAVVNMADAVRALFTWFQPSHFKPPECVCVCV